MCMLLVRINTKVILEDRFRIWKWMVCLNRTVRWFWFSRILWFGFSFIPHHFPSSNGVWNSKFHHFKIKYQHATHYSFKQFSSSLPIGNNWSPCRCVVFNASFSPVLRSWNGQGECISTASTAPGMCAKFPRNNAGYREDLWKSSFCARFSPSIETLSVLGSSTTDCLFK